MLIALIIVFNIFLFRYLST